MTAASAHEAAFRQYLEARAFRRNSVDTYGRLLRHWLSWCEARAIDPVRAPAAVVADYVEARRRDVSRDTAKHAVACVRHWYAHLRDAGLIEREPEIPGAFPRERRSRPVDLEEGSFELYLVGRDLADTTIQGYIEARRRWLSWLEEEGIKAQDATAVHVAAFLALRRRTVAGSSLRQTLSAITHHYRHVLGLGPKKRPPQTEDLTIRRPHPKRPAEPFSREEQAKLYAACETPLDRALYLLMLDTALRATEIRSLKASDIDVGRQLIRVLGKGGKYRTVTASERTFEALAAYFRDGRGFWGYQHTPSYQWLDEWLKRLGRRAGVAPPVHLHRLRTTFAVEFAEAGGGIDLLQVLLGHSSLVQSIWYSRRGREHRALEAQRRLSPVRALV